MSKIQQKQRGKLQKCQSGWINMNINNSTAGLNSASWSSYFWTWLPSILTQGSIRTNLYWATAGELSTLTSITTQKENILLTDAVAKMTDRLIYVINK